MKNHEYVHLLTITTLSNERGLLGRPDKFSCGTILFDSSQLLFEVRSSRTNVLTLLQSAWVSLTDSTAIDSSAIATAEAPRPGQRLVLSIATKMVSSPAVRGIHQGGRQVSSQPGDAEPSLTLDQLQLRKWDGFRAPGPRVRVVSRCVRPS